jgi:sn-glycerol 3-phosphate transport system permease protein
MPRPGNGSTAHEDAMIAAFATLIVLAFFAVVLVVAAVASAARFSRAAFERASTSKMLWIVLPIVGGLLGLVVGVVASLVWFFVFQPRVASAAYTLTAEGGPPALRRRRFSRKTREAALGYLLVLPSLLVFGTFVFYPFFKNFQLSLYRTPPFPNLPKRYVGLQQFKDVLGSADFHNSLKVTLVFVLLSVPLGIILGLLLAVVAHQRLRGIGIYRTIFSSTVATSVAVASVIFFTLLNPQIGLLNYWLGRNGALSPLDDPKWALIAVAGVTIWQNLGLSFILMSSGLQGVPDELLESARVDGASAWSRFRNVTVPMLSPTLFFAAVVGSILAFHAFGQIDLLTQGGPPHQHTNVLIYAIYTTVFQQSDTGKGAVYAIVLFAITLVLTLIQLRFLERRVQYER